MRKSLALAATPVALAVALALGAGCSQDAGPGKAVEDVAAEPELPPDEPDAAQVDIDASEDVEPDVPPPLCDPDELKDECASATQIFRCQADGMAWQAEFCPPGEYCLEGACKPLACEPGAKICAAPKSLVRCDETSPGVFEWVHIDACEDGLCKNGKCRGGCGHAVKLGETQDCASWDANFTTGTDDFCTSERLLALPSSGASEIAVFDISVSPPLLLPGSPFDTCKNPSRILLDSDTNIIASCRDDGVVTKHTKFGETLWWTQLPGCTAARGVVLTTDGRLLTGCSSNSMVYALDPASGDVLKSATVPGVNWLYGLTADDTGLYVADLVTGVRKLHLEGSGAPPDLELAWESPQMVYGFAVDADQRLWLGGSSSLRSVDTLTGQLIDKIPLSSETTGLAVDLDGRVWAAMPNIDAVASYLPGDAPVTHKLPSGHDHPRGLAVDPDGHVYTVNLSSNNASRIDAATGEVTAFGAGSLLMPYGYSGDMTGLTANCLIEPHPTWKSPVVDSGDPNTVWKHVSWEADVPADASLQVSYRLDNGPWTPLMSKAISVVGQKFQLKFDFVLGPSLTPATLHWAVVIYE